MPLYNAQPYVPGPGDGLPGRFTLPGDPSIVPAGLEAVLEYNNLYMNIQKNIDRYRINSIDGLYDADIRDTREVNTGEDGESPYNSFYGGRTITISGTIDTYSVSKLRAMQYALRRAFADISKEYPLIFRTGNFANDHMISCKKIGPIAGVEEQSNLRATRDFQVSLRASNPRFLSFYENYAEAFPAKPTATLSQIATVHNRGTYRAHPVFRVYGPATNVLFVNDATDQQFSISKGIPFADYLEFNMAPPPTLVNSLGQNRWSDLDDDSDKIYLVPGDNPIFYAGDTSRVQILWRDSWL
jgi:hypothetical protein